MSGFHESLDAALGRASERDDDRYVPGADDATNLGLLIFTDATPGGTDRIIKRILASDWLAQRIEQAKAEERERIATAFEAESQRAHAAFASDEDDHLADMRNRLGVDLEPGYHNRHDDGCGMCGLASAARIAREVPHA